MKTQTAILFIFLTSLTSCQTQDKENHGNKKKLAILVEVTPEGDNSYTLTWKDTVGKNAGYGLINRTSEVWCFVVDKKDTVGYYKGLSTPADYTSFSTADTIVSVTFMIGPNIFSTKNKNRNLIANERVIEFYPVPLNLKSKLSQPIEIILTEKLKHP
jgi:hypothetical protein